MSDPNTDPEPAPPAPKPKPSNIEKYNKDKLAAEKATANEAIDKATEKADAMQKLALDTLKARANKNTLLLIEKLDPDSQILVLQTAEKNKAPDSNIGSVGTPTGGAADHPLAKYMTKVGDRITWSIPATEVMVPDNFKKIRGDN